MDSINYKKLNKIKNNKNLYVRVFLGSNISLYISFIIWFVMTFWNNFFEVDSAFLYLLSAITAGAASAYLLFTWLFYAYVRYTDSLVTLALTVLKMLAHISIIVFVMSLIL